MNTEAIYDRLQSELDLVALVKNYILLQKGRKALKGDCPLHEDNKSFMVVPGKNTFKCFGCGAEGGPVEFYALVNRLSKQATITALAGQLQLQEKRPA